MLSVAEWMRQLAPSRNPPLPTGPGILARSEKIQPVSLEEAFQNGKWVEAEFGNVDVGHEDRGQRFLSRKQALHCLRWHTLRWRLEEWHRVLKSGCRIESHRHRTADRLARAISIDAVIAWRVMLLGLLGREVPEMHCELMFSPWECKLLERLQPLVAPDTISDKKNCA